MLSAYEMLKQDEGLRYKAYKDTKDKVTVGIGFNMDDPHAKGVWIKSDIPESFFSVYSGVGVMSTNSVNKLFNTCLDNCRIDLESIFTDFESYPVYVQLALYNMMFTMGKAVFSTFNGTIELIKSLEYAKAAQHILGTLWARDEAHNRALRVSKLLQGDYSGYTTN